MNLFAKTKVFVVGTALLLLLGLELLLYLAI